MTRVSSLEKNDTVYFRQIRVYELLKEMLIRYNHHQSYEEQKAELINIILHLGKLRTDLNLKEPILSYKPPHQAKLINLTPLQAACAILDLQIIEVLLENVGGMYLEINAQDRNGNTALHWALQNRLNNDNLRKIRALLIAQGADEQIQNKAGKTAENLAVSA